MPPTNSPAPKPQRRFQFIDNSNVGSTSTNSTQVRRHVMQEYMREKRWEARAHNEKDGLESEEQPERVRKQSRTSPLHARPGGRAGRGKTVEDAQQAAIVPQTTPTTTLTTIRSGRGGQVTVPAPSKPSTGQEASSSWTPVASERLKQFTDRPRFCLTPQSFAKLAELSWPSKSPDTPSSSSSSGESWSSISSPGSASSRGGICPDPSSWLSAARTDPFDCLPMKPSARDAELFDFYATVMPACSYGFERRHPRAHNWYRSVFIPEGMKSPTTFQNTILVHAAKTQAWVMNLTETPLTIEHSARASELLALLYRESPHDTSDAAITATMSAAALEDFDPRLERRPIAWMHWRAAVRKIRDRGGPEAMEQSTTLRMLINWQDYIFSGYDANGATFFFDHLHSPQHSNQAEADAIAQTELRQQFEEFVVFLRCTERLALVAADQRDHHRASQHQVLRYAVFEPNQPLHRLLSSSNGPRYTQTGQLKQIISRLAALMTINVAVWEYRYPTLASEAFFQELLDNVRHNDLDRNISVEALLQILLSGSANPQLRHSERPWLVGRLLKVAKRLSRTSWERLNDFLLRCLTLTADLRPVVHEWEHDLRREVLSAPLSSAVLPIMQT